MNDTRFLVMLSLPCMVLLAPAIAEAQPAGPLAEIKTQLNDIQDQIPNLENVQSQLGSLQDQIAHLPPTWSQKLPASERFVLILDGAAVLDKETGLVWEKSPDAVPRNWDAAQFHCNSLNVGNRLGWRLPTIQELASLVDPSVPFPGPTLPAGHPFSGEQPDWYWSATTSRPIDLASSAWVVRFNDGGVHNAAKSNHPFVWCVRGGQGVDPQ